MLLKKTLNDLENDDSSFFDKKSPKKSKGFFSSLFPKEDKYLDKDSSFYTSDSGFFDKDEFNDLDVIKKKEESKPKAFNFNWWEYAIIGIELLLLIYAILVFLNQVALF